jgi:hypothetical protein
MMDQRLFDPVGKCIYCGDSAPPLTREHIIPSGLGGLDFLPEASCTICAKETGRVEQFCLRTMLWPIRNSLGLRSKYRHKDRPERFPVDIVTTGGPKTVDIEPADHPVSLAMPLLDLPGILNGRPSSDRVEFRLWIWVDENAIKASKALGGIGFVGRPFEFGRFARLLAKIAHAKAVAELGVDGFAPLLPNLVLGNAKAPSRFVGCYSGEPIAAESNVVHRLHLEWLTVDKTTYVNANIRLFAQLGTPTYLVVVGTLPAATASATDNAQ